MKYIAIDIGSSFVKSALLDMDAGYIAEEGRSPSPNRIAAPNPRHFEIPAALFVDMVREHAGRYAARFDDIAGILLSVQMHGFVYRTPRRPETYVSWQDLRCLDPLPGGSASGLDRLREAIPPEALRRAGVPLKPSLGLCNLYSLLAADAGPPRDGTLHTLGSFVISRLTGSNVCHLTSAAPLGLVDVELGTWAPAILEAAGLAGVTLPAIAKNEFEACGTVHLNGRDVPVYPDFGDQQTAILGCLAGERDAIVNVATAAQVIAFTDAFVPGPYEVRPYFENRFIKTISNMPGGRSLEVLVDFLRQAAEMATGKQTAADRIWRALFEAFELRTDGLRVDTCFYPVPGNLGGGGISGIGPANLTPANLFAAAFIDMARTYWENIKTLCPDGGVDRLICAGGVSWKNPFLLEAIRRESGRNCALSPIPDECMSGLFRIALVCSGYSRSLGETLERPLRAGENSR